MAKALAKTVGQGAVQRVHRLLGNIQRRFPHPQHLRKAVAVIAVFVRDENTVEVLDVLFDGCQARQRLAFAEAGVNEEAGMLCLE